MSRNNLRHWLAARSFAPARSVLICAGLIGAGWLIGSVASRPSTASAEVINSAPDQHFLSGDQLSLPVLQDIAATLHQMDARLSHLESVADRLPATVKKHASPESDNPASP
ncbi:MAG TPA: hypothetical protein VGM76_03845 [Lacipirellulaceae bacterium]|jgi:hypothetical protein